MRRCVMGGPGRKLRELIGRGETVLAAGCYDPLTAKLAERLGFEAAYLGAGTVGYILNVTEAMITVTEMATAIRQVTQKTRIPLIVDGATGFGEPLHTMRTVREYERAGAAAIEIEDQIVPKRAHHHKGVEHLVPLEAMVDKVKAAVAAREDADFIIIARTNAMRNEGLSQAIERGRAYRQAGADMILVGGRTREEAELLHREIGAPLVTFAMPGMVERLNIAVKDMAKIGYPLLLEPHAALISAFRAVRDTMRELKETGTTSLDPAEVTAIMQEINQAVDLPDYWRLEELTVEKPAR
ncbi:MAG: isocitrate lyase/PEP mutase family protein [Dehalococcoidia bacterium]|nr:isocitrate lyase/PEP mutase family protein [Dehalococcoidia bacterium]